eukprot:gene30480-35495_t
MLDHAIASFGHWAAGAGVRRLEHSLGCLVGMRDRPLAASSAEAAANEHTDELVLAESAIEALESMHAHAPTPSFRRGPTTPHKSAHFPCTFRAPSVCISRLKELQKEPDSEGVLLRIEVEGGGCSGFQYKFSLVQQIKDDDKIFEQNGARVVTDAVSLQFLRGAKVEFEDNLMRSAFVIGSNPNSESSCGCGTSFTAKMD